MSRVFTTKMLAKCESKLVECCSFNLPTPNSHFASVFLSVSRILRVLSMIALKAIGLWLLAKTLGWDNSYSLGTKAALKRRRGGVG
jgi:hypothetical protein